MENVCYGWWYNQFFINWKKFEVIYVSVFIVLQVFVYLIVLDSVIGMVLGVFGILCLVYGMKGCKIFFIFGVIQCLVMIYVVWILYVYGFFVMDIFYVIL